MMADNGASIRLTSNQALGSAGFNLLALGTAIYDSDSYHDGTNKLTIPVGLAGKYLVNANFYAYLTSAWSQYRTMLGSIYLNGSQVIREHDSPSNTTYWAKTLSTCLDLAEGDYLQLQMWRESHWSVSCQAQAANPYGNRLTIQKIEPFGQDIGARVTHSTTQAWGFSAWAAASFDTERWDSGGLHDTVTNNSRLTVPSGQDGKYFVVAHCECNGTGNSPFSLGIRKNGSTFVANSSSRQSTGTYQRFTTEAILDLSATDYLEVMTLQYQGGYHLIDKQNNRSPEFAMQRIA
jgi:hypothetical protein